LWENPLRASVGTAAPAVAAQVESIAPKTLRPVKTLTREQRLCNVRQPAEITHGLDAVIDGFIGRFQRRRGVLASLRADAEKIDTLAAQFAGLSDARLRERLAGFR